VFNLAVADRNGRANLYSSEKSNWHSLLPVSETGGTQVVETVTLDSFVSQVRIAAVDLVRMDIEGFECTAINGMRQILNQYAPILLIEIHPHLAGPQEIRDLLLYLHSEGYDTLWLIDRLRDVPWLSKYVRVQTIPLENLARDHRILQEQRATTVCLYKANATAPTHAELGVADRRDVARDQVMQ
jgi:hypothetical protein